MEWQIEQQMKQNGKRENKRAKKAAVLALVLILLLALAAGAAGLFLMWERNSRNRESGGVSDPIMEEQESGIPATESETKIPELPEIDPGDTMELQGDDTGENPELPDMEARETNSEENSGVQEPDLSVPEAVPVKSITVFPGETAIFQCYEKEALEYRWEYYSTLDKKWEDAGNRPEFVIHTENDSLNRQVSCLSVPGDEGNDQLNIRCTAVLPEQETAVSEGELSLFPGQIKEITIGDIEAEAGEHLSHLDLKATVELETGERKEVTGFQSLFFCVPQDERESTVYDEENSLTTETHTKVYKESAYYPVQAGAQTAALKFHVQGESKDMEAAITGTDTKAPSIDELRTEYKVSGTEVKSTPVKIYVSASDHYSLPSELTYSFSKSGTGKTGKEEKLSWTDQQPLEVEVTENGDYDLFVKDAAGNIAKETVEIIAVDTKPPVIEHVKLREESGSVDSNTIEVTATDKTELEYSFCLLGTDSENWQKEPEYSVVQNGTYRILVRDQAGNVAEECMEVSNIDMTPPVIVKIYESASGETENQGNGNSFRIETVPTVTADTGNTGISVESSNGYATGTAESDDLLSRVSGSGSGGISITTSGSSGSSAVPTASGTNTARQGIQGAKGEKGETGAAGVSSYVHIRYSADHMGTGMTAVPDNSTKYIGIYSGTSKSAPTTSSSYKWSLYQGENTHVYMKYALSALGEGMTEEASEACSYIGFCITTEDRAPEDALQYTWSRFRPEDETLYVRYSPYENGAEMTDKPQENSSYIGICTSTLETAPADSGRYEWSRYKGSSAFLHVRYSTAADGSGMTEAPAADSSYIGICNNGEPLPPSDASSYTWVRMKGTDGSSSHIHVKYSVEADGTGMTDSPNENSCYMGICISEEEAAPEDAAAYKWCRISYGKEMAELQQSLEVMQAQMDAMKSEIEELKNR